MPSILSPPHLPMRPDRSMSRSGWRRIAVVLGIFMAAAAVTIGCGSSSTSSTATSAAPGSTTGAAGGTGGSLNGSARPAPKVSANTASATELEAALTAAGVTNAARWTKEIQEYRPYPADDPSMATLRKELQKYKPAADQLEKIIGALQP